MERAAVLGLRAGQLAETLTVMMAAICAETSIIVPVTSNRLDEAGIVGDGEVAGVLAESIRALAAVHREGTEACQFGPPESTSAWTQVSRSSILRRTYWYPIPDQVIYEI